MLSLSLGSTYALVRTGDIPAKKMGGRWVIPKRRFHAWLDDLPEATTEDLERDMRREDRRFHAWLDDLPEATTEDLERDMRREDRRFPRSS
jgi:excisionase family DNA binding protein